ncbi:hypothetical protein H6P81_011302 [Aristolochia fimbriata]|uniref:Uncharacterized protein n=1 Tax=Aristolochia fimbriata TaxID=158543 RepID=A0AAV7EUL9_ARIFI|nr:hypothetical protein H6P81_011302 [Aristolochia fimbriata]
MFKFQSNGFCFFPPELKLKSSDTLVSDFATVIKQCLPGKCLITIKEEALKYLLLTSFSACLCFRASIYSKASKGDSRIMLNDPSVCKRSSRRRFCESKAIGQRKRKNCMYENFVDKGENSLYYLPESIDKLMWISFCDDFWASGVAEYGLNSEKHKLTDSLVPEQF